MKRLFQHNEGELLELKNIELFDLKSVVDTFDDNVILLWLKTSIGWLRIFIDGYYCGIDQFEKDNSKEDQDPEYKFDNLKSWVINKTCKSVIISNSDTSKIQLTITLNDSSKIQLICSKEEYCVLEKNVC
jgi:hypothetical protein